MRAREDSLNTAFELTDCVDFVTLVVMFCLNVALLSKTTLL